MGHYELAGEVIDPATGEVLKVVKLKSISFARMDQVEFEAFFERALRTLSEMAGGIDYEILRNEVLSQLAAA